MSGMKCKDLLPLCRKSDTLLLRQPQAPTHWLIREKFRWNRLVDMVRKHLLSSGNMMQTHHARLLR